MKKIKFFVIPFFAVAALFSCESNEPDPAPEPTPTAWYTNNEYLKGLTKDDIGSIQTLKINGLDHQVRLIGIDEDKDNEGNTNHTTWEFTNLICDENGYSLGTLWNDTDDFYRPTGDYLNSSIRKALNGSGGGHYLWSQKGETEFSKENRTVIDMLDEDNPGLVDVIKTTNKTVEIYNSETSQWEEKDFNDKLFLLTPGEMGENESDNNGENSTYSYYSDATDLTRVKKQIKGDEVDTQIIYIEPGKGQKCYDGSVNLAGWNKSEDVSGGGIYYLRSPNTEFNNAANAIFHDGSFSAYSVVAILLGIAPVFCL